MSNLIPRNQTLSEMFSRIPCLQKLFCRCGLLGELLECPGLRKKDEPGGGVRGVGGEEGASSPSCYLCDFKVWCLMSLF